MAYYNNKKVLSVVRTEAVYDEEMVDKTARENNVAIARTLLINLNGRELTNYSLEHTTIGGYEVEMVKCQGSASLTEAQVKTYLSNMTGSERIPVYEYERPLNTFVMTADGTFYKLQANPDGDNYKLYCFKVAFPYTLKIDFDNLEAEVNRLKAMIYETIVEATDLELPELILASLPDNVDSDPIVFGAGMDAKEIKGNSRKWNQLAHAISESYWYIFDSSKATLVKNGEVATITIKEGQGGYYGWQYGLRHNTNIPMGHVYLASTKVRPHGTATSMTLNAYTSAENKTCPLDTWSTITMIRTRTSDTNPFLAVSYNVGATSIVYGDSFDVAEPILIDLTDIYGAGNEPTSVTDAEVLWLMQYATLHPEYNADSIIDSKPTKLISRGFNQWDEEWEIGTYSNSDGSKISQSNCIRSKNPTRINPNASYYLKSPTGVRLYFYDANHEFIEFYDWTSNATFTTPANAYYMNFRVGDAYGTTYNNDICINISNASLNGTYVPSEKHEYPLDLPVLRSAGSVQDTDKKANVEEYTFTGNETYTSYQFNGIDDYVIITSLTNLKYGDTSGLPTNYPCRKIYTGVSSSVLAIQFPIGKYANVEDAMLSIRGYKVNIPLATPTDQPSIDLPENIAIQEGGSIEAVYDDGYESPADFTFEVAVEKASE